MRWTSELSAAEARALAARIEARADNPSRSERLVLGPGKHSPGVVAQRGKRLAVLRTESGRFIIGCPDDWSEAMVAAERPGATLRRKSRM